MKGGAEEISLDKQVQVYSVDTSSFYNDEEHYIHNRLSFHYKHRSKLKKLKSKNKYKENIKYKKLLDQYLLNTNKRIDKLKKQLNICFTKNNQIRTLRADSINPSNIISIFDSVLTRTMGLQIDELSKDIIVVQTYFFDVLKDLILHGFIFENEKYVCFTASAGQIRTKKTVFIKESLLQKHQNTLMCGLTIDEINRRGGMNINKYLAYLALCNSATDKWDGFDIDRAIVVEDMETTVRGTVDFIDEKTFEITRQEMDIPINHTDGCGMVLPSVQSKNTMVRLPWVKGLLVPFPFDKFIQKFRDVTDGKIKDIYGKEYSIKNDNIQYIFTRSQFKMHKYYDSWEQYKEYYKKYNCQAAKCNEEEDNQHNKRLNYQMLQTLTDITDDELKKLCEKTNSDIQSIGNSKSTMLNVLGVRKNKRNLNYYQQALKIYPELLTDTYSKEILKQMKKSMVKEARAGKIELESKYAFICPDLYAFCEYLFLGDKNPKGLLRDGEVSCRLFDGNKKLDCLRSPHLYREHAVRVNVVSEEINEWFVTNGIYTSVHDLISKVLMFDNDGDVALVVADELFVSIAERNMIDIVPLLYNMAVANKEKLNQYNIYNGLKAAYTGGNIGIISNDITKIWNSENINLDVIKWLCLINNQVIDYAKTLFKTKPPKVIKDIISQFTKKKVPYFFQYAKDKEKHEVEKINNSTVNRLKKIISNPRLKFEKIGLSKFDYKMIMYNSDVSLDDHIIEKYTELDLRKRFMSIILPDDDYSGDNLYVYKEIRNELLKLNSNIEYVVDVLVKYLYSVKNSSFKTTLWSSFGDVIVENLEENLKRVFGEGVIQCEDCTTRFIPTSNRQKYCQHCWKERERERKRKSWHENKIKYKKTSAFENN